MFNTKAIKATILFTAVCVFGWIAHGVQTLAQIEITNEVYTAAQTDAKIVELAPTPGDYSTVSNRAMNAVQSDELGSDIETLLNDGLIDYFNDWLPNELDSIDENNPRYYKINQPFYLTNETVRINVDYGSYNLNYGYYELALDDNGFTMVGPMVAKGTSDVDTIWNLARLTELYLPRYIYASVPGYDESIDLWSLATTNDVLDIVNRTTFPSITDGTNTIDAAGNVYDFQYLVGDIYLSASRDFNDKEFFGMSDGNYVILSNQTFYIIRDDYGHGMTPYAMQPMSGHDGWYEDSASYGDYYFKPNFTSTPSSYYTTVITNCIGKLALTNDIPPAVQVVTPSTNAVKGTAADAQATGTALYTGFTEWEFSGNLSSGMTYTVEITEYEGPVYIASLFGSDETSETTSETVGVDSLDVVRILFVNTGITATRHLVTPTRTSQIKNDGDGTYPFATTNQIPNTMLKAVYEGDGDIFSEWAIYGLIESVLVTNGPTYSQGESYYFLNTDDGLMWVSQLCWENESTLFFHPLDSGAEPPYTLTAKRKPKVGYVFGDQTDKVLAATNSIPLVVSPSTNAENGTAADAKATGIALYTGYTTWEPYGENPGYKLISVEYNSGSWKVVYIVDGDSNVYTNTTSGAGDETDLTFHSELNSITRHLVTPTKTSQLINDSSFVTTNNSGTIETSIGIYGSLKNGTNVVATGIFSHAEGGSTTAEGSYSHSEGNGTFARGLASHSEGLFTRATERASHSVGACALATNSWSFVWSGLERSPYYGSHGVSSFNVNPINGINGFYIGEQTLQQAIVASIMDTSLSNDIEVVYQNQDNSDAAMISDIVVTQAVTNHVPTIRTAVRDVVDNAIGNGMVNVTNHYSDWFFTGLPSGVTVTSLQYTKDNQWQILLSNGEHQAMNGNGENSTSLLFLSSEWMEGTETGDVTADRFFQLQDRSMNILTTWGLTVPLSFPKPVPNKFREFRLRLVITAQPSSADYLNLHGAITNGVEETISFETDDGTFPSVTTISTNLYHFVETAPSIFYVEKKQLTPAPLF